MDMSVFSRGMLLAQANKLLFQEKDMIEHSLRKEASISGDKDS
jgi:hypothetical protein